MNIKIVCVGKIKEKYYSSMLDDYVRLIGKKHNLTIIQKDDEKIPKNASEAENRHIIDIEGQRMMEHIEKNDYVIALCIDGEQLSSEHLSKQIDTAMKKGANCITFLIGGSLGMSDELVRRADYKMSFSSMTFPHQLMRVMLLDQIYNYL